MNQHIVSIQAQIGEGALITEGLVGNGSQWVAIDNQFSLFGLAEDKADENGKAARLSLEILLDDIQTNLSSGEYEQATSYEKHVLATRCIEESFENINDYLINQKSLQSSASYKGVAMSVLQVIHGECSFIHPDEHCCLHFREGKLKNLSHHKNSDTDSASLLGISEFLPIRIGQLSVAANDLILTCNRELLQYADEEYLRVTLSRFQDSPQMAIRQITSKAQRGGMKTRPLLIMVTINQPAEKPGGWFKRQH
jgi:hypothetical protein